MDYLFDYSIIQACPDEGRGERVNIGAVVFGPNGADVRLPELRKLRQLTGHGWEEIAEAYKAVLEANSNNGFHRSPDFLVSTARSSIFTLVETGKVSLKRPELYEKTLLSILEQFVDRPKLTKRQKQEKINTEISKMLKTQGLLSTEGRPLEEGLVVPKFVVSETKEIVADFAYRAKRLKVVSTLELRNLKHSAHKAACEKGATMYFAREEFRNDVTTLGVYAATESELQNYKSEIEIFKSFAGGHAYNWMNPKDRQSFRHDLY
ncbi:DUF3037 domain-containing protein [Dolichospermum circinale CS-537/11]|nr:DUF3037 domain-containing protein [Dolichospermum circinale]MDB9475015.1 DUF3037 domain-containing protein [Dolichospermum circinale CS-537/11]